MTTMLPSDDIFESLTTHDSETVQRNRRGFDIAYSEEEEEEDDKEEGSESVDKESEEEEIELPNIFETMDREFLKELEKAEARNAQIIKYKHHDEFPILDITYNAAGNIMLKNYKKNSLNILHEIRKGANLNAGALICPKDIVSQVFHKEYFRAAERQIDSNLDRLRKLRNEDEIIRFVRAVIILKGLNVSFDEYAKHFSAMGFFPSRPQTAEEFLQITKERFNELLKALNGKKSVEFDEIDDRIAFPELINDAFIATMEEQVPFTFRKFMKDSDYILFDDDKIEKVVKQFNDGENCKEVVQTCLKALYNVRSEEEMKSKIKPSFHIFADRGYLTVAMVTYVLGLGAHISGTSQEDCCAHRGTDDQGPVNWNGKRIPTTGTKGCYCAEQDWELDNGKTRKDRLSTHDAKRWIVKQALLEEREKQAIIDTVHHWVTQKRIIEYCSIQAQVPWYEFRTGLITGTVAQHSLRMCRVELATNILSAKEVLSLLGHKVQILEPRIIETQEQENAQNVLDELTWEEIKNEIDGLTPLQVMIGVKELHKLPAELSLEDHTLYDTKHKNYKDLKAGVREKNVKRLAEWRKILYEPEVTESAMMEVFVQKLGFAIKPRQN
eukprot:Nk52_evm19s251 gene=Nk52_evmTU19s251